MSTQVEDMRSFLEPLLAKVLDAVTPETIADWSACITEISVSLACPGQRVFILLLPHCCHCCCYCCSHGCFKCCCHCYPQCCCHIVANCIAVAGKSRPTENTLVVAAAHGESYQWGEWVLQRCQVSTVSLGRGLIV